MKPLFDLTDILPNAIIMETTTLVKNDGELIARFMGLMVFREYAEVQAFPLHLLTEWVLTEQLDYHSNWSRLMPVVEKINDHPAESYPTINIDHDQIFLHFGKGIEMQDFTKREYGSWIGAVYAAVVSYVKWHNANN